MTPQQIIASELHQAIHTHKKLIETQPDEYYLGQIDMLYNLFYMFDDIPTIEDFLHKLKEVPEPKVSKIEIDAIYQSLVGRREESSVKQDSNS